MTSYSALKGSPHVSGTMFALSEDIPQYGKCRLSWYVGRREISAVEDSESSTISLWSIQSSQVIILHQPPRWASAVTPGQCYKNTGFPMAWAGTEPLHPGSCAGAQQHDSLPLTKPPGTHFLLHIFIPIYC